MTKITIEIETEEQDEMCNGCRFLNLVDGHCMLFVDDVYADATMNFMRCESCMEHEVDADG